MLKEGHGNPPVAAEEASNSNQSLYECDITQITITNGSDSRTWPIHKNVLQSKSPYFAALPNFQEGADNKLSLEDINFSAFGNFVTWLYQDHLDPKFKDKVRILIHTWTIADRFMAVKCKNMAMDALRTSCVMVTPSPERLTLIDELGYNADSLLAQFLMDQMAYDCVHAVHEDFDLMEEDYALAIEGMQTQMTIALVWEIIKKVQLKGKTIADCNVTSVDPSQLKGCHYHEHAEGEECYLTVEE